MNHRMLPAWFLSLFCAGVCAQSAVAPAGQPPRLPGDAAHGMTAKVQFQFGDGHSAESRWARQVGQGAVRMVAQEHGMTNHVLVRYARPGVECMVSAMKPECP